MMGQSVGLGGLIRSVRGRLARWVPLETASLPVFLAVKGFRRHLLQSVSLTAVTGAAVFLCLGGSLAVEGVQNGFTVWSRRLSVDLLAVSADTWNTADTAVDAWNTADTAAQARDTAKPSGYWDRGYLDRIRRVDGVDAVSPLFLLTDAIPGYAGNAKAAYPETELSFSGTPALARGGGTLRILGYDAGTEFALLPWTEEWYGRRPGNGDVVTGSAVVIPPDGELTLFGVSCRVAARLAETGTAADRTIYANLSTIRTLIRGAQEQGIRAFDGLDPETMVSAAVIRVKTGRRVEDVAKAAGEAVPELSVSLAGGGADFPTGGGDILPGIAGHTAGRASWQGAARVMERLEAALWPVSLLILTASCLASLGAGEREWICFREMGASHDRIRQFLFARTGLPLLIGALAGTVAALAVSIPAGYVIRTGMRIPSPMPGVFRVLGLLGCALAVPVTAGGLAAAASVWWMKRREK